jgi:hypothetical protein
LGTKKHLATSCTLTLDNLRAFLDAARLRYALCLGDGIVPRLRLRYDPGCRHQPSPSPWNASESTHPSVKTKKRLLRLFGLRLGAFLPAAPVRYAPGYPDVFYCRVSTRAIKNVWRRPTLPPKGSTIGAEGLNFRVRNGNGWDPFAMITRRNKCCYREGMKAGAAYVRVRGVGRALVPRSYPHAEIQGYPERPEMTHMVKPHEKLVLVGSTCYHAYTSSLSTR